MMFRDVLICWVLCLLLFLPDVVVREGVEGMVKCACLFLQTTAAQHPPPSDP